MVREVWRELGGNFRGFTYSGEHTGCILGIGIRQVVKDRIEE